jgi:hypothetical protein
MALQIIMLLTAFFGGLWFLFGMPVVVAVCALKCRRIRKLTAGLLVSAVMLLAFYAGAILLWGVVVTMHYWNLPFLTMIHAAGNAEKYGHPIEHAAQGLLVGLLFWSTVTAVIAGIVTATARYAVKRQQLAA